MLGKCVMLLVVECYTYCPGAGSWLLRHTIQSTSLFGLLKLNFPPKFSFNTGLPYLRNAAITTSSTIGEKHPSLTAPGLASIWRGTPARKTIKTEIQQHY